MEQTNTKNDVLEKVAELLYNIAIWGYPLVQFSS